MRRQGTAGQEIHFERTHQTLPIARMNPESRLPIDATEERVKPFGPLAIGDSLQSIAKRSVARRSGKEPARQRSIVETCSTDENRQLSARGDISNHRASFTSVARGRVLVRRIGNIDEMVRNSLLLAGWDFVCADIEPSIHGGRIAADDLALETACERNAQCALAGCGRTDNRDE